MVRVESGSRSLTLASTEVSSVQEERSPGVSTGLSTTGKYVEVVVVVAGERKQRWPVKELWDREMLAAVVVVSRIKTVPVV